VHSGKMFIPGNLRIFHSGLNTPNSKLQTRYIHHFSIVAITLVLSLIVFNCRDGLAFDRMVRFYKGKGEALCSFRVELAITPEEHSRGLMFRKYLDSNTGMLFIFDDDDIRFFWMKDTLIPLDIIFINSRLEVVDIHRFAKPMDEMTIVSRSPVRYVLEIKGGKADYCGIKKGVKAKFVNIRSSK
jgi:uncharacterized protein